MSFSPQGLVQHMTNLTIHNSNRQQSSQKTQKLFLVFYQTIGVQQKFNIDYIQLSRLDFIHFILMHS